MKGLTSSTNVKKKVVEMLERGRTVAEIARSLGCARGSLYPLFREWGIDVSVYRGRSREQGNATERKRVAVEENRLRAMVGQGRGVKEIADELGCSSSNVYRYCSLYGIKLRRKWADIPLGELESCGTRMLAEKYGIPERDVYKLREKNNIVLYSAKDLLDEASLKAYLRSGYLVEDIAILYKCSSVTVVRYLKRFNLPIIYKKSRKLNNAEKMRLKKDILVLESWEVLKRYDISVFQYQNAKRVKNNKRNSTKIDLKKFETEYIINGKTTEALSKELGLSFEELESYRIKHKIPKLN